MPGIVSLNPFEMQQQKKQDKEHLSKSDSPSDMASSYKLASQITHARGQQTGFKGARVKRDL